MDSLSTWKQMSGSFGWNDVMSEYTFCICEAFRSINSFKILRYNIRASLRQHTGITYSRWGSRSLNLTQVAALNNNLVTRTSTFRVSPVGASCVSSYK